MNFTHKTHKPTNKYVQLLLCIILDLVGLISYFFIGIGEFSDIIWAPIASIISYKMFKYQTGWQGALFTFVEEILPVFDFIPSFTINWIIAHLILRNKKN